MSLFNRRSFLAALGATLLLPRAWAQGRVHHIGWLTMGSPKSHAKLLAAFRAGLKERGWVEGRNITLELRWAEGHSDRILPLAQELVRLKPDVILTAASVLAVKVRQATSTIPIVMATSADPVG